MMIPKHHTDSWINVLKTNFGAPRNQTGTNKGLQFKTADKVSIKLWIKKKSDFDTILIDGQRNKYINFAKNEMPKLFKEVIRKSENNKSNNKDQVKNQSSRKSQICKLCDFKGTKASIKGHMIKLHSNGDVVLNLKQKSFESKRVRLPRKSKTILSHKTPYLELDEDDELIESENDEKEKESEEISLRESGANENENDIENVISSTDA